MVIPPHSGGFRMADSGWRLGPGRRATLATGAPTGGSFCPGGVSGHSIGPVVEGVFARDDSDARGSAGFALDEAAGEPSWLRMLVGELLPWGSGILPFGCGARSAGPGWAEMKSPRRTRGLGGLPVGIGVGFSSPHRSPGTAPPGCRCPCRGRGGFRRL